MTLKAVPALTFPLADVVFTASINIQTSRNMLNVATYSEAAEIELATAKEKTLSDWLSGYISKLQDFFSIAFGRAIGISEVSLRPSAKYIQDVEEQKRRFNWGAPLQLYFQPIYWRTPNKEISPTLSKIFLRPDIPNLEITLNEWFKFQDEEYSRLVCQLFLGTWYRPNTFLETRFLNLAQAVEVYHRAYFDKSPLTKTEFERRKKIIIDLLVAHPGIADWYDRTQSSNNQTFYMRLLDLYEWTKESMQELFPTAVDFSVLVRDTRNFYTHYDLAKKSKAATDIELYELNQSLSYMLIHLFLLKLELTGTQIAELLKHTNNFIHLKKQIAGKTP